MELSCLTTALPAEKPAGFKPAIPRVGSRTLLAMTLAIECYAQAQRETLDRQDLRACKDCRVCKDLQDLRDCKDPQVNPGLPNISRPLCWASGLAVLYRGPLRAQSTGPQGLQDSSAHVPT